MSLKHTVQKAYSAMPLCLLSSSMAFAQYSIDMSSTRGAGISETEISIENIRVSQVVANPFAPGTTTTNTATYTVTFRLNPTTLHLEPVGIGSDTGCASVSVTVTNAVLGQNSPIAGATVTISGQTATTNAQGVATFTGRPSGTVTISAVASNFVVTSQPAILSCTTSNNVSVSLSPSTGSGALSAGSFRVITTWGENPRDLDSHLTGPDGTETGRWHVYYSSKTAGDMCGLDVDDTSSFGPETMTCPRTGVTALRPGIYRYSVHHYSGTGNIGNSSANVRLELAGGQFYNFTPPAGNYLGSSDVWTVFELTVNTDGTVSLANVNSVQNAISASSVRHADRAVMGSRESLQIFQNLDGK